MRIVLGLWFLVSVATGETLAPWSRGMLDIHQIHTGRGNASFLQFPDGTTMLLDAGSVPERAGPELGPQRPNASRTPTAWIAAYLQRYTAKLDYAVVTHYHDDHLGAMAALAGLVPIAKLIDRGDQPAPPPYPVVRDYLEFRRRLAGKAAVLQAGQILAQSYPAFEVRNVAANGQVWTGHGTQTRSPFPPDWQKLPDQPTENDLSLAFRIRYGKFDYYTGGDLAGIALDDAPAWHDLETPIAQAIGQVDVAVLNHHGWLDTTNNAFLRTLQPRVVVIPAWHASHPDHSVLRRLRSPRLGFALPDLFITELLDAPRAVFGYLGNAFKSNEGHIVIRVTPGGGTYSVFILDDRQENPSVKAIHGPYLSR